MFYDCDSSWSSFYYSNPWCHGEGVGCVCVGGGGGGGGGGGYVL